MGERASRLTKKQLQLLNLIYTFRFATAELLAHEVGLKDRTYLRRRLDRLRTLGYIGRYYNSTYRYLRRPAVYYLQPKVFPLLKPLDHISSTALKAMYVDGRVSRRFINQHLDVFKTYQVLHHTYGQKLWFFTSNDLKFPKYDYFPSPLPDAFLSLATTNSTQSPRKYFLLLACTAHLRTVTYLKRFREYGEYIYSHIWRQTTGAPLSGILILTDTESYQKRLRSQTARLLSDLGLSDMAKFYITTTDQLKRSQASSPAIWQAINETSTNGSLEYLG
jgi:protein involved in plasmid replication-relaxation